MDIIYSEIAAQYFPILVFFAVAVILSVIIVALPQLLASKNPIKGKLAAYECGFDAFGDARGKFDIRFYLVAILFIIFDLEIAFLIPWSICFENMTNFGFWSMMFFIFILTIGLVYEWNKGALEWE